MEAPEISFIDVPYVGTPTRTHRMAVYGWGKPSKNPPIICIHGLTRNARDFDFLANALAENRRVIALDMPGRGKSQWLDAPEEYAVPFYVANVLHVLATLGIARCDLVGTSMGGMIGMALAAHAPAVVRKLVLNDVGVVIPAAAIARIAAYVGRDMTFPSRAAAEPVLRARYAPFAVPTEAAWQHLITHSLEPLPEGSVRLAYDPAISANFAAITGDVDFSPLWEKVGCETLVIRGADSDLLSIETHARMGEKPGVQLFTVPGAGHAPLLSTPFETERVREFLSYIP